ncbi:hypothetical protein BH09MYX1_BH09MYX1_62340 [soil metagenome]
MKKYRHYAVAPLLALLAHVLALRNGFALDDFTLLTRNPYVQAPGGLKVMLTSSLFAASAEPAKTDYYRPLTSLLNWTSFQVFHDGHAGQHALNLFLHLGIVALFHDVLLRGNVRRPVALVAASFFAIHPATVDVVAYIGGRQDMLGWLCVLGAYRLLQTTNRLVVCGVLGAAAMILGTFSREAFLAIAAVLPIAAAIRTSDGVVDRKRGLVTGMGAAFGFGVVALARHAVGVRWNQPGPGHGASDWIQACAGFLARMLKDFFAPTDLVVDLDVPKLALPLAILLIVLFVISFPLAWRAVARDLSNRRSVLVFGHMALFATVAIHTPVALRFGFLSDRYAYPFILAGTLTLAPLAERAIDALAPSLAGSPLKRILPVVPWLVIAALIPLTWSRVVTWRDETSLQTDMYAVRPDDPHSKFAEGMRLMQLGQWEKALPLCQAYLDRYSTSSRPEACIGNALLMLKRPKEAIPHLKHYAEEHLASVEARVAVIDTMFRVNDLDAIEQTLDEWGPDLADAPDMVAARKELEKRRASRTSPPHTPTVPPTP